MSVSPTPNSLLIALPKGRMADHALDLLSTAGLPLPGGPTGRKLILHSQDGSLRYVLAKPTDVPTFVEYGAADMGVCGLDTLRESRRQVYEPLLLPFGHCRLCLAGPVKAANGPLRYQSQPRVATKYPNLTEEFFRKRGVNAEIIVLNGSVELAPLVGLADLIVDIIETGSTLKANGLVEQRVIMQSQAVLVVNRAAYHLKAAAIQHMLQRLRAVLQATDRNSPASPGSTPTCGSIDGPDTADNLSSSQAPSSNSKASSGT